ncbi:hypothetical protein MYIN104542_29570 [Mycobacterium intermedium]
MLSNPEMMDGFPGVPVPVLSQPEMVLPRLAKPDCSVP